MKLLNKNDELKFLASEFEDAKFNLFVSNDPLCYLSCVVCVFDTSEDITSNWRDVQGLVSGYYRPSSELAMWNIYIIFFAWVNYLFGINMSLKMISTQLEKLLLMI